jgi:hypothetical protein
MLVDSTHVDLNGIGDDECEPCVFPGDLGFNFCKTRALPYDAVVTACLLVARDHFPSYELSISSDGSWPDDWQDGSKLYSAVLGRTPKYPMSPVWRVVGWRYTLYGSAVYIALICPAVLLFAVPWLIKRRKK